MNDEMPATEESNRPCPNCDGTADRIGEDTHGRPYWFCANCGTEFQTDPE